ncbi:MAG: lipoprotein-releasing ABC transporter permease subunit [Oceanospirillales bacterium TMED33]|nr:lipoprotein-releasing system transmembrane subunit LolC [Gammaproteobacteria bacterium]RPG20765.1 MAG: lipoprotein-releasing ABC transporter permease subunit [Oceanospirillales bacterium TMED33]CAI8359809.1 MAG: Lipoprotein-releasing system transmembrane protein LolE [Gammaproteobacteria bacterium]
MYTPLSVCIGLRYTRARRRNHFISFISAVSIAGLTLGVAVLILVLSVLNGFDRELRNRILGTVPHALLEFEDARTDLDPVVDRLLTNRSIAGVAPLNQGEGLLVANGQTASVAVLGVDPEKEAQVSILPGHMTQGEFIDLSARRFSTILGSGIAANLGVVPGDQVTLLIPDATVSLAGVTPRMKRLEVAGIFEVGAQLDNQLIFVRLSDAARLFKLGEGVAALRLQFDNLFDAPQLIRPIAQEVSSSLGLPIRYQDWTRTQGNLFEAIQLEKTMIALLLTLIIAVAAFNIVSTLVMVVTDKRADIAILKTIGLSPRGVMGVFVVQGTLVGVVGTVLGVILGVPLALTITGILDFLESVFGFYLFNPSAYFISDLPSELRWSDVGLVAVLSIGLSLVATLYPALKASRIVPAEILNHER